MCRRWSEVTFEENEVILAVCVQALAPGQVFGWSAVLDCQDTLFQVRARERTTALRLNGAALASLCRTDAVLWRDG